LIYHRKFLYDQNTPITLFKKLKDRFKNEPILLFESAISSEEGNFSFVFVGEYEKISYKDDKTIFIDKDKNKIQTDESLFDYLKKLYKDIDKEYYKSKAKELGVGFIDGFVGYIGYDAVKIFEPVLKPYMDSLKDDIKIDDITLSRPRLTAAFSHKNNKLTLLSVDESLKDELEELESYLKIPVPYIELKKSKIDKNRGEFAFDKKRFFEMVEKSKEMIRSGDVFQILMSNRFTQYAKIDRLSFYRILRSKNPSPYMFYLDFDDFAIIGSSPEVMVCLNDGDILLRPIAGTRKRGSTPLKDKEYEDEMLSDEKERAEHLMLVDLGRNDVGRVAKVGSVKVTEMMRVERYSHVMHMVSDVEAVIADGKDAFDLFRATFTAGTMTGAPKIRAMELIAEYEKLKRGFYSGAVGYFAFNGEMDSSIAIRTSLIKPNSITLQAGAGIVADSVPELEYIEVKNKLRALLATIKDMEKL